MRSLILTAALVAAATPALAGTINVNVDQSRVVRLKAPITGVVVGNAAIADVIVHDPQVVFIMGKNPGITQIIAVDAAGRTVIADTIRVGHGDDTGLVTVNRGGKVQSQYCSPRCAPAIAPGDTSEGLRESSAAIGARAAVTAGTE